MNHGVSLARPSEDAHGLNLARTVQSVGRSRKCPNGSQELLEECKHLHVCGCVCCFFCFYQTPKTCEGSAQLAHGS